MNQNVYDAKFIPILNDLGLNLEEAKIYLMILRHGVNGMIVKRIIENFPIKRTTCYSLLDRLIKKKFIFEGDRSNTSKRAKTYVAVEPITQFKYLVQKKKKELKELEELSLMYSDTFQKLYQEGIKFSLENLDPFIIPYLKPLLEKGWKIKSQIVEKTSEFFDFDIYDYDLEVPNARLIDESGFHIFVFGDDIEKNFNVQKFLTEQLKRKTKAEIVNKSGLKDIKIKDGFITLFKKNFPSIIVEVKFPGTKTYQEVSKTAILPIKNKIFGIWAESLGILEEMAIYILLEEGIKV